MKPILLQQEVLLSTNTQFAHRQLADKDTNDGKQMSSIDKLEKACWDGLIKDLIPELDSEMIPDRKLWLWQIHQTTSFLALDFYEYPGPKENHLSVDPHLFMADRCFN